ncbi:MAG: DNA recombination protein RmuC [Bacteroidaceae bacterium]|nr:DNA recombination protein RmuC [Bacteroidaceae bacterium]
MMTEELWVLAGLLLGLLIGWLIGWRRLGMAEEQQKMLVEDNSRLSRSEQELRHSLEEQKEQIAVLRAQNEQLKQNEAFRMDAHQRELDILQKRHEEAVAALNQRFSETVGKVTAQMETATQQMLRQRQEEFSKKSQSDLGQIVNPLRETIDRMRQAMTQNVQQQTEMSGVLKANIEQMIRQSEASRNTTEELVRVFRHGSKVQGDWGEWVLDELLTSQGLKRGIHYDTQATVRDAKGQVVKTSEGRSLRPDVILHVDERREIIIDSKVSLTAFFDYVNAQSDAARSVALSAHLNSLKTHVKELSTKDYASYVMPPKVCIDYVIMFVPHNGALLTALNADPKLWRWAMDQNVFIADEQTLFAALRIINMTWTHHTQALQHQQVYELAEEMLERVGLFIEKFEAIGKALDVAQKAYEQGHKKLLPQGPSILQTAHKLTRLGAKANPRHPLSLYGEPLDETMEEEN